MKFNLKKWLINKYIILFLLFFCFIILLYNLFLLESFGSSNEFNAFLQPTLTMKKWQFANSKTWYNLTTEYKKTLNEINFIPTSTNNSISILFSYYNAHHRDKWRSILRVTNTNFDCCAEGDRLPTILVSPNTSELQIHMTNPASSNTDIISLPDLPLSVPIFIGLVIDGQTMKLYVNNVLSETRTNISNSSSRNGNTKIHIGGIFNNSTSTYTSGNLYIKDLTIYDGALSRQQIDDVYKMLDGGTIVTIDNRNALNPM